MILLCLHAGMAFTLTSAREVVTLSGLLNTLLMYHTSTALTAVPSVLHLVNKLLSACVHLGGDDRLAEVPQQVDEVVSAAQTVARSVSLKGIYLRQCAVHFSQGKKCLVLKRCICNNRKITLIMLSFSQHCPF